MENTHQELLDRLKPLLDFMDRNGYHYFLVAGKDETCTRYFKGKYDDLEAMTRGMIQENKEFGAMMMDILNNLENQ